VKIRNYTFVSFGSSATVTFPPVIGKLKYLDMWLLF